MCLVATDLMVSNESKKTIHLSFVSTIYTLSFNTNISFNHISFSILKTIIFTITEYIGMTLLKLATTNSGMHRSLQISARKRKNFATMTDSVCQAHHLHRDFYCFSRNIKKKRGKHCLKNKK